MRQKLTIVACVLSVCACPRISGPDLFSCEPRASTPSRIEISPVSEVVTIAVGQSLRLTAAVRPVSGGVVDLESGRCNPLYGDPVPTLINWFSLDPRIATVSSTGVVSGLAAGDAIVVAQAPFRFVSTSLRVAVRD